MRSSELSYATLRRILLDLGFAEKKLPTGQAAFHHDGSDTLIVLRTYELRDLVSVSDLVAVRTQLDAHGVLSTDAFEARLRKASA